MAQSRQAPWRRRRHSRILAAAAALVALLGAGAARAEVTAAEVWQGWKDYYAGLGYTVAAGSEVQSGDTLTLGDVTMSMATPEGTVTSSIAEVVMTEAGGQVRITLSPEIPVAMRGKSDSGETIDMAMAVSQRDLAVTVSGTPEAMTYDYVAASLGFEMGEIAVDGKPVELKLDGTMTRPSGRSVMTGAGATSLDQTFAAEGMAFDLSARNPEGAGTMAMKGSLSGLTGKGRMAMPEGLTDLTDTNAALRAGLVIDGGLSYGAGEYEMHFVEPEKGFDAVGKVAGGDIAVRMDASRLSYAVSGGAAEVSLTGQTLPFPVNISVTKTGFSFLMPVTRAEVPGDFGLSTSLVDLKVSDEIWGLFDPTAQLPRDPATLILDLTGKVRLLVDIMDPKIVEQGPAAEPGELHAVDLRSLMLKVAGAELTGTGAFTFDNSDRVTFDGMPKPLGSASFRLIGGNTLIDKLVAMGLLPEEQATGIRMMAGMFANAGPGPDEMNSTIEVREDGGLYANGQRLR